MQPNGGLSTRNKIIEMAEAMRSVGDGCTKDDLLLKGFTERQINIFGPKATELATVMASAA
ncbi:hypothetical protein CN233_28435 [Sinorhizobium meliloti]|uniref:hypothetical protein n=1 Tax=Rhizobium meliloti TaxID=382 RepID=UPI0003F5DF34|nr:hypothetical protein [Sinorhizobium meliloti]MDE3830283.1 hypothetical protein [Sinorhizobium meliloti]MDE4578374.1 hypothetical protein [Sinorhizobium meliloti]MDW9398655.1 hypothetical protein [Sinorhizobium meliloti]MDW9473393.1 hypothetical protein [Sinorhizobium meliloti]MDX0354503.1 hypothetical protein [Sinorhizobium meliloti]